MTFLSTYQKIHGLSRAAPDPSIHGKYSAIDKKFLIPAILFLLCLVICSAYEFLKKMGKINSESKPIFALVFAPMCVIWIIWFNLAPEDPFRVDLSVPIRWIGLAIFIMEMVLAVGALVQLRGVENIDHLATTGLFRRFRHPIYIGFIAWIVGCSMCHGAVVSLAIGAIGIANVLWRRHLVEGRLQIQFGSRYQEYRLATWF